MDWFERLVTSSTCVVTLARQIAGLTSARLRHCVFTRLKPNRFVPLFFLNMIKRVVTICKERAERRDKETFMIHARRALMAKVAPMFCTLELLRY